MQTQASAEAAYDARPWLGQYPPDVDRSLEFPEQTIWELLDETAARFPDRQAFIFQHRALTFRQIRREAERMAAALHAAGVRKGDVVMAILPNITHFPIVYYGAMRIGAAVAAAPPNSVGPEIEVFLRDSGAKTVITLDLLFDKVAAVWEPCGVENLVVGTVADYFPAHVRLLGKLTGKIPGPKEAVPYGGKVRPLRSFLGSGRDLPPCDTRPDDAAVLQYTGGTTGTPKAAVLTHHNLLCNARQMRCWFPSLRDGEETILGVLPFFHVYGQTLALNAGLLMAATSVLIPRPIASEMLEAIARYRPSIFPGVPTIYVTLINDKRAREYDLSSIDICVSGGAPLPLEVKRDFERLTGGHLYEGYGLSEASPVTHAQPHDGRSKVGSMGLPVANTDARIVDAEWRAVPIGEEGELCIRGPQVMREYWGRPEETADVLRDGWLRTGDVARMDDEGWFYIVDRKKDLIITGGENIYPREVEEALFEHPAIQEVAVVGVPHPFGGEIAKAFVVLKPGEQATKKDIVQFASERLAKHKVPRAVEFRSELPKSAAQKVLRRVLAEEERKRQAERGAGRGRRAEAAAAAVEDGESES
jgi:long-chain acyl-CoA synthetase